MRFAYRSASQHCGAFDASAYGFLELAGPERDLLAALLPLASPDDLSFRSKMYPTPVHTAYRHHRVKTTPHESDDMSVESDLPSGTWRAGAGGRCTCTAHSPTPLASSLLFRSSGGRALTLLLPPRPLPLLRRATSALCGYGSTRRPSPKPSLSSSPRCPLPVHICFLLCPLVTHENDRVHTDRRFSADTVAEGRASPVRTARAEGNGCPPLRVASRGHVSCGCS